MIQLAHVVQPNIEEQWRLLWSHAAYQIVSSCSANVCYPTVAAGMGHGFRHPSEPHRALLVHPASKDRHIGDLALTVLGSGTHVIPRCGRSYVDYLDAVSDIVETTARNYLTN